MNDFHTGHHSRLIKQENKRMVRQTILIVVATIGLLVAFVTVGISGLIRLAVALGNAKGTTKVVNQEDNIPPQPPQLNPVPEATSSATLDINGFAEAGSVVTLYLNTAKVSQSTTDNQGNFSFSGISLTKGTDNFTAIATDAAGNPSQMSASQTVSYSTEPPKLTVDQPQDGSKVVGNYNQLITVSGSTDPDVQLTLNSQQLVVTGDGTFSTTYQLQDGDNKLTFTATDKAGNQTIKDLTVNFSH